MTNNENTKTYDLEERTFEFSKKDFVMRVKISRKEAKESRYWLRLLDTGDTEDLIQERSELIAEATELMNIFGAILRKS
jgi:four helix bundle protein